MWNCNKVSHIKYQHDYIYQIVFDDGLEGLVDFAEYLTRGPIFDALNDVALFRSARIEGGTIAWPNGADVAPETLYHKLESLIFI
ncbi:MAG: DUF2442 domain-containing protein [Deltaproteobacteria bacterium]|nr:DUF2442 domain-containing protein [Deltaproteobacteria bacterium]